MKSLNQQILEWKNDSRTRTRMSIQDRNANTITIKGRQYLSFCSNDYLSLSKDPRLLEALVKGAERYGVGSGSASMISGYFEVQQELEMEFAKWLQVDKAILFNSGYLANIGIITSLANRSCTIYSDRLCHSSLLDGIQLSRARHRRYQHNSILHLQELSSERNPDMIVTESVFSMQGDIAPIPEIIHIAKRTQSALLIDDAHGIGVLGSKGRGILEHAKIQQEQYSCLTIPLGKAFNAMGAIVAGRKEFIDVILQFSKSYRYTTALPPALCSYLLMALEILKTEPWRREKLLSLISFFNKSSYLRDLKLVSNELTPIRSIIIGNNKMAIELQKKILSKGFYVSCIRPPTVPENTARLRISLNSLHTEEQIISLLTLIRELLPCNF